MGLAGESISTLNKAEDKLGFQVIIPRKIDSKEIIRSKPIKKVLGWRYSTKAHGKKICLCPACLGKGEYNSNKIILNKYNEMISNLKKCKSSSERGSVLIDMGELLQRRKVPNWDEVLCTLNDKDERVQTALVDVLKCVDTKEAFDIIIEILDEGSDEVKAYCSDIILLRKGMQGFRYIEKYLHIPNVKQIYEEYLESFSEEE